MNTDVLLFSLVISVATGILFGVLPALQASRVDLNHALKQGSRSNIGGRGRWLRDALVVTEVAMALVLLAGAGLMLKTLSQLRAIDVGFRPEGLLTMRATLPMPRYKDGAKCLRYYETVLDRVRAFPGVRGASFASDLPFTSRGNTNGFQIEGRPERLDAPVQDALYRVGSIDYLKTLGVRLIEGRFFGWEDRAGSLPVIIINETFARTFYPNESPIGKRIQINGPKWITIAGVVADVRERGIGPSAKPGMYLPVTQDPERLQYLVVRADGDPLALAAAVRAAIGNADPDLPVSSVGLMQDIIETDVAGRRQQMRLLIAFAALALTLAGLGVYGVLSYVVVHQTREIGVRMALGARAGDIVRTVAIKGAVLTGIGLTVGTGIALVTTRMMRSLLYGVGAADPLTYLTVIGLLAFIGTAASTIPALRAARVDPVIALRDE